MRSAVASEGLSRNLLYAALPEASREAVARMAKIVELREGESLFHAGDRNDVLFPVDSVVSLLREFADGTMIQVSMVGCDGLVDINTVLRVPLTSFHWIVQSRGLAARIQARDFMAALDRDEQLRAVMMRYANVRILYASQLAACNRQHVVTERLAYWLLLLHDRVNSDEMFVTQEFLARMLATRRAGINVAMRELRESGAILHRRNVVTVANRDLLEEQSCACYEIMLTDYEVTLGFPPLSRGRRAGNQS